MMKRDFEKLQKRFILAEQAVVKLKNMGYKYINDIRDLNTISVNLWGVDYNSKLAERAGIENFFGRIYRTNEIIVTKEIGGKRRITQDRIHLKLWFNLGYHNYLNSRKGGGLEHIFQNHKADFNRWGYKTYKDALNFVVDTITNKKAIIVDDNLILYKIIDKYGRTDYMIIAHDTFDGHFRNIYGINPTGRAKLYYLLPKINILL